MDWIKLGRNVKYARARKGYTQAEVAELYSGSVVEYNISQVCC